MPFFLFVEKNLKTQDFKRDGQSEERKADRKRSSAATMDGT
jgi:hypothetical protein